MKSFAVTGLPRSRSAWMSVWLSCFPDVLCLHDALYWAPPEHIRDIGRTNGVDYIGVADSAFLCMPKLLDEFDRILYVARDRSEVAESLENAFGEGASHGLYMFSDQIPDRSLVVPFDEIDESLEQISDHLVPEAGDPGIQARQVQRMRIEVIPQKVFSKPEKAS